MEKRRNTDRETVRVKARKRIRGSEYQTGIKARYETLPYDEAEANQCAMSNGQLAMDGGPKDRFARKIITFEVSLRSEYHFVRSIALLVEDVGGGRQGRRTKSE